MQLLFNFHSLIIPTVLVFILSLLITDISCAISDNATDSLKISNNYYKENSNNNNNNNNSTQSFNYGKMRIYGNGYYLSRPEEIALDKFRPMIEPYIIEPWMFGDNVLIKFLRARNLNLERAASMMKKTIEWRKMTNLKQLLATDYSKWEKLFPFIISGLDKKYGPIFYILAASYDIRKAVIAGHYNTLEKVYDRSFEKGVQFGLQIYEEMRQNAALEGTLIIDLTGFNLRQHACVQCLPIYVHVIQSYESYYPQTLRNIFLINAPRTIETVLQIMRPLMSAHTREALQVYDVDSSEWKPVLKKYIADDQLLVRYGGTRKLDSLTSVTLGG